jgi:acetyl esterase/lipase
VRALLLVYPPLWDAEGDVPTAGPMLALAGAGIAPPAVYLVGSTNDRVCSVHEHVDPLADQLCQAGARVCYHRAKLGAHGFGLTHKWAVRAAPWIWREMRLAPAPGD